MSALGLVTVLAAALVAAHGLVHVTGFALLWDLAEPANLTYAEATPEPGTLTGRLVGLGWLAAGGLFVAGAVQMVRSGARSWLVLVVASALSLAVLLPSDDGVSVGITMDLLIVAFVIRARGRRGWRAALPPR